MGSKKQGKELEGVTEFLVTGLNREQVAAAFGVSVRCIAKWLQKGMPRGEAGFSLPECITWFADQQTTKQATSMQDSPEKSQWLDVYRRERARLARMERKRMEGALIPKSEVVQQFTARAYEFGRALLQLGRRFSAKVAGKTGKSVREVERIHEAEARKVLEDYARPIQIEEQKP